MGRRFRRRKTRVSWFPPLGSAYTIDNVTINSGITTFRVDVLPNGDINTLEVPLTFDFGQEELLRFASETIPTITLADLQESAWRLKRIVGKIHAAYFPASFVPEDTQGIIDQASFPAAYLAAGFMVRNVASDGLPSAPNVVNLLTRDDYTDPWVWRRTWVLGQDSTTNLFNTNLFSTAAGKTWAPTNDSNFQFTPLSFPLSNIDDALPFALFPKTNAHYGSVADGPHVDQKTNRRIGPEQRMFLHFATKGLPIQPPGGDLPATGKVIGVYDLRFVGSMLRASNRRNAAR